MTIKYLDGYVQGPGVGYYVASASVFTELSVKTTGTVEGVAGANAPPTTGVNPVQATAGYAGLLVNRNVPIVNSGSIVGGKGGNGGAPANSGVTIGTAGYVGGYGVNIESAGYLNNLGVIDGGNGGAGGGGLAAAGAGGVGVSGYGVVTVFNAGHITAGAGGAGGNSTSGSAAGHGQQGGTGVVLRHGGTLSNSGTVKGGAGGQGGVGTTGFGGQGGNGGSGVFEDHGGTFLNSGAIFGGAGGKGGQGNSGGGAGGHGGDGVELLAVATLTNSGTITGGSAGAGGFPSGSAGVSGYGVYLTVGGAVVNSTHTATIVGAIGVKTRGSYTNTITNYGTIQGTGGVAVEFTDASDRLIDEPGSLIFGRAVGGGGTLELAPGYGTISGMGLPSGATFSGFGVYSVDSGGTWTIAGDNATPLGTTLSNAGVLTLSGTLTNYGLISGVNSYAMTVAASGSLVNLAGGVISGASHDGLVVSGVVLNYASITGVNSGADLEAGGLLLNRAVGIVDGVYGVMGVGAGTLQNYGSVGGTGLAAALFAGGGTLTNYKGGVISGSHDGFVGLGVTATNSGTIQGLGGAGYAGFLVGNSVATNTASGVMEGYSGVVLANSTLVNGGLVDGYSYAGVYANSGGLGPSFVTNTAAGTIEGAKFGVVSREALTVVNFGTIKATSGTAVAFGVAGGRLIVESGSVLIGEAVGDGGVLELAEGGGTLALYGATGTVTGSAALASAGFGTYQLDAGAWTMSGTNTLAAGGVILDEGSLSVSGTLTNGGTITVGVGGAITLTGKILGAGTVSVLDTAAGALITIANGSVAQVQGALVNAGTIALASTGSATDLRILGPGATLSGGGSVMMSGSTARILGVSTATKLTNVDNTIAGTGFIGVGQLTLINQAAGVIDALGAGSLVVGTTGEVLTNAGLMEATGSGLLVITHTTVNNVGGTIEAASGSIVDLSDDVIQGGTVGMAGGGQINVNVAGGELDGSTHAVTLGGLIQLLAGKTLILDGAIANTGRLNTFAYSSTADLIVGAAGATLSGKGSVNLSNSLGNRIYGLATGDVLTNVDNHIDGAGLLGKGILTLVNQAAGQIVGNQNLSLTIDTGANTIMNAGLIENVGKGGTLIKSAVNNTGILQEATAGTLTLAGKVTGTGVAKVSGGTLYVVGAFAENVTFTGTTGVLKLGDSQAYTGKITGLSKTGTDWLDLADIGYVSGTTKASFSGTTASGVLTVTDGTHTAKITLIGNYTGSTFTVSSDGHGGTKVVDPTSPASAALLPFVAAAASFGAEGAGPTAPAAMAWRQSHPALAAPSAHPG